MRRPATVLAFSVALFVGFVGASLTARAQSTYRLAELSLPQGVTNFISVSDINDRGEAAGYSQTYGTIHTFRGLYWDSNGAVFEVGDLPGGSGNSICSGINNQGVLSGRGTTGIEFHAFIWDSTTGTLTDLGTLPNPAGPFSYALQINNHNQVIGFSSIGAARYHPFLWNAQQGMIDLGELPNTIGRTLALGLNDLGQVAGWSQTSAGLRGFVWDETSGIVEVASPPGTTGFTTLRLNNLGQIAGWAENSAFRHARLYTSLTESIDLGDLPAGNDHSYAIDVNDQGTIVGTGNADNVSVQGEYTDGRAYVWNATSGMRDLNDLVDVSGDGWILFYAQAINNLGQIVGEGFDPAGEYSAFLLTPNSGSFIATSADVTRGTVNDGLLANLAQSDDKDFAIARNIQDIQANIELVAETTSPVESPLLQLTLESSVFGRGEISQTISIYNYDTDSYEQVDSRNASRFVDQTTIVSPTGDSSRFVEPATNRMRAKINYSSPSNRASFKANIDMLTWDVLED